MLFGAIVLRDVPKEEARIDLVRYDIRGGFRGFRLVPPGPHYVSVKARPAHVGLWCWVERGQAVVRVYDGTGLVEDDPAAAAQYSQMALSGAMDTALLAYASDKLAPWIALTGQIEQGAFPPRLHEDDLPAGLGTRFDSAFLGTHAGDVRSFLAEFQFAFLCWLVSLDTASQDQAAFARWQHLLLASYNAGEERIGGLPGLFVPLVGIVLAQFQLLPDDWFAPGSFVTAQAGYLAEDMIDSAIPSLVEQGRAFARYLDTRRP